MPFNIKFSPKLAIVLLITLFFAIAMFIRIYYPYNQVFVGDWVKYTGNDAYYQMRLVDNMVQNFPHITAWDPYLIYPDGAPYGGIHFFNYLLAFIIWVVTLGAPTAHAIDMVGVYFPVVLAALCIIPAYFMGKALFNRWAGVIAAGMMAVLPGEFMGRSILGGTDQHVAETLFSAVAAMFVIFALRAAWQSQLSWDHVIKRDWKALLKPLLYSLLAGIFIGIYMITWIGALLLVFIIAVYIVIQFIVDHFKGQSSFYLGFTGFFIFLPALLIFLPQSGFATHKLALVIAMLLGPALAFISRFAQRLKLKTYLYPVALAVIAGVFLFVFNLVNPTLFNSMFSQFSIFTPGGPTGSTTIEMQPFLSPQGTFNIGVAWGNFTTSFFLTPSWPIPGIGIIAFVLLIVLYFRHRSDEKHMLFFFVWSLVILIATLTQRRFAYYLVVNIALLSSYLCWQFIWWLSKRRNKPENQETLAEQYKRSAWVGIGGGVIINILPLFLMKTTVNGVAAYDLAFLVPVLLLANAAIFFGFWSWARLKGKSEFLAFFAFASLIGDSVWAITHGNNLSLILWAFLMVIAVLVLYWSRDESSKKAAGKKQVPVKEKTNPWLTRFNVATLVIVVLVAAFYPNYDKSKIVAAAATFAPSDAWEETLHWLKANTPEPLDTGSYDTLYNVPADYSFDYPASAYGVTSWWDYGYWITRTGRRLPSANPSQNPAPIINVANLFLSQDRQKALDIIKTLNSKYIILDETLTTTKLWAVATWAGIDSSAYTSVFYYQNGSQVVPVQVYDLNYYKLLSVRLFNFSGKASTSEKPIVITYDERTATNGQTYRLITDAEEFSSYAAALQYIGDNPDKKLHLAGSNPFVNPIPIEAVPDYEMVFGSSSEIDTSANFTMPSVKVFHFVGN